MVVLIKFPRKRWKKRMVRRDFLIYFIFPLSVDDLVIVHKLLISPNYHTVLSNHSSTTSLDGRFDQIATEAMEELHGKKP